VSGGLSVRKKGNSWDLVKWHLWWEHSLTKHYYLTTYQSSQINVNEYSNSNKAIVDSRLWQTQPNTVVITLVQVKDGENLSSIPKYRISAHWSHWHENMMSSIKLEVNNVSQCHQRTTEPQPQATGIKSGKVWPDGFWVMWANRQNKRTHSLQYFATLPGWSK